MFYGGKKGSSACNSITQVIFLKTTIVLGRVCSMSALCILLLLSRSIKRCTYGSRMNKISYFTVSSAPLLSETLFSPVGGDDLKNSMIINRLWCHCSDLCKAPSVLPKMPLYPRCKCQHCKKNIS